jgi:hypothetical protein
MKTGQKPKHIVTCYLVTRQIISGLRILYLDLLVMHQAELQLIYYSHNLTVITPKTFTS